MQNIPANMIETYHVTPRRAASAKMTTRKLTAQKYVQYETRRAR